ncbi:MAG: transposase [Planctomycetes bacterium]|nr:transposase [Planctomycetota bacterium]
MATTRRHFGADQKAAILKRYLVEKVPLSDLCDEYGIQPNQIYQWQAALFENASAVLDRAGRRGRPATLAERRIAELEEQLRRKEAKLQQKNEVIAELMEENIRAKKANGGP